MLDRLEDYMLFWLNQYFGTNWGDIQEEQTYRIDPSEILYNAIKTPDGTVLESRHTHDFRCYTDTTNNKMYGVDGGRSYLKRVGDGIGDGDYVELSVYDNGSLERARNYLEWGSRGKDGTQSLVFKKIKDMSNSHIDNILKDNEKGLLTVSNIMLHYFKEEIKYRYDNGIVITDIELEEGKL